MSKLSEFAANAGIWPPRKRIWLGAAVFLLLVLAAGCLIRGLGPAGRSAAARNFEIKSGDGFRDIAGRLASGEFVRSRLAFEFLAIFTGNAGKLKPGIYELNGGMSVAEVLGELVSGVHKEVTVMIPEGASVYDVDRILSGAGVISSGGLVAVNSKNRIEGKLFPDTYIFFTGSDVEDVVGKLLANFKVKVASLLGDNADAETSLIPASLVEKEVPEYKDRQIVAGIIMKRLKTNIPLQIDATICYAKAASAYPDVSPCYPLSPLDFKIDSPYNTYLHSGLPPGPIGNPGLPAINAVLSPKSSPYWYYLSDPETHKTIFSRTLDEQEQNRVKYLRSNY